MKYWEQIARILANHLASLHEDYPEELDADDPMTYAQYWIAFADWKAGESDEGRASCE